MQRTILIALVLSIAALGGCQLTPTRVASDAATDEEMFVPLTKLVGTWEMEDPEDGVMKEVATFAVFGAGSAVREIMHPGQPYEMTNIYHMDGRELVITHYCAAGNQPRMVATAAQQTEAGTVYEFAFDSISNLREDHAEFMGSLTLTLRNDGTVQQDWRSMSDDGSTTEPFTMLLQRRVE